jgi:lysozyme
MAVVMSIAVPNITTLEGQRAVAYRDVGGVLTVCAGHTGPDVVVGKVYDPKQCAALTQKDAEKAASGVLKTSPHLLYHPLILASAISFSYNVGVGRYQTSSVATRFNAGDFAGGCAALLKYNLVNGVFNQGLANRRQQEYNLCTSTLTVKGLTDAGLVPSTPK